MRRPGAAKNDHVDRRIGWTVALLALALAAWIAAPAGAQTFCSDTADDLLNGCEHEVLDDWWVARAICVHIEDAVDRADCQAAADAELAEEEELCDDAHEARLDLCAEVGEDRYSISFLQEDFDDDFTAITTPNPHYPIAIGNTWEYEGGEETIFVEVLDRTKLIFGVRCIVVRDQVFEDGDLIEDTYDWFALRKNGAVYYCGEEAKDYETFEDDDPALPELVAIDGSFKVGREGDKPGRIFLATPSVGDVYREEYSLANAEDVAEVLSTSYSYGDDEELDEHVPQALAEHLCSHDCVVTLNYPLLEPDDEERKYYAPGIGAFLEVNVEEGTITQLTDCNFDARCATLPEPDPLTLVARRPAPAPDPVSRPPARLLPAVDGLMGGGACDTTAHYLDAACGHAVADDYAVHTAICLNLSTGNARANCRAARDEIAAEETELCEDQLGARLDLCVELAEDRYEPPFDPLDFDDDFTDLTSPNPYRPLGIGYEWSFEAEDETVEIEVLDRTKDVDGVTCIVVRDRVYEDEELVEDTDDWFAQALDGAVWYCGEEAKDYELFEDDDPALPELVEIDGSFKAGRDGDKAGILMPAPTPAVGDVFRQEWSLGNAEDVIAILSTDYGYGDDEELDDGVPSHLARTLCDGDCWVTLDGSSLEPGVFERKYHAPGIGTFLEIDLEEGGSLQLTACSFDARCDELLGYLLFEDGFESGDVSAWSEAP